MHYTLNLYFINYVYLLYNIYLSWGVTISKNIYSSKYKYLIVGAFYKTPRPKFV